MKTLKLTKLTAGILFALVATFSACSKEDDLAAEGTLSLRIVNSVEGSAAQDFYQGDQKLATGVVYASAGTKVTATTASRALTFTNTGATAANATTTVALPANVSYAVFYAKRADGTGETLGYDEDNTAPASGKARVRFINLGPLLTGTVQVTYATATLASALAFKASSTYQTIDAGTSLNVAVAGSLTATTIAGSEFQAGKIYTVWFDSATATTVKYHVIVQE